MNGWVSIIQGYQDTEIYLNPQNLLEMSGTRYEYSGKVLPNLRKWGEGLGMDIKFQSTPQKIMPVDPPRSHPDFLERVKKCCAHITQDPEERIFHSHGQTLQEMYALKFGKFERTVDVVVYPGSENDVEDIMALANEYKILLVPFGGGTNVTHALQLDSNEDRFICSVDMSKMNHVRKVNLESMTAVVEAGIVGKDLEEKLSRYGVCCGHEPDSIEFSTLGG